MKKKLLSFVLCTAIIGYFGYINAQRGPLQAGNNIHIDADSFTIRKWAERHAFDSFQNIALQQLLKTGNYDSVVQYCNYFREKDSIDINTYELAIAATYWPFGERPKAYDIVMKNVQYDLSLHAGGQHPFQMLCDYSIGLNLTTDKLLEDMVMNKVSDYYSSMNNPETSAGLKLIRILYNSEKLIAKCNYMQSLIDPKFRKSIIAQRYSDAVQKQFEEGQSQIFNDLAALIQNNHQKLYTDYQVGTAQPNQMLIINAFQDSVQHDYFDAILKTSLADKSLTADDYVGYALQGISMKHKDMSEEETKHAKDSLCRIYKCTGSNISMIFDDKVVIQKYDSTGNLYFDTVPVNKRNSNNH
ncbi:hypothetical protein F0919_03630 [Taibaiella lutea]|uniref:Uncharacterized protein n=1 Tax=Taibaiella lutea TaxID=2608001 RepID=A0A5M6CP68_9BACT|nr:hypothetical protein [Taibaiella lutea]KAA5536773.1 hypothetical protein F0919_03630 [Taibaiella lutea]